MILIRHKRTGNTKMFLDPHSAALDLWGKDARQYQVFVEARDLPHEVTALERQLTTIHNSLRDKTYAGTERTTTGYGGARETASGETDREPPDPDLQAG